MKALLSSLLLVTLLGCYSTHVPKLSQAKPQLPRKVESAGRPVRVILQVDGGGILGITPARLLARLEQDLNTALGEDKPLGHRFSLVSGASTGAIISGLLTAGVPAKKISEFYLDERRLTQPDGNYNDGVQLFRSSKKPFRFFGLVRNVYDREPFERTLDGILECHSTRRDKDITLGDLSTDDGKTPVLAIPAFELRAKCSVIFNNRMADPSVSNPDAQVKLRDVIRWSGLSAAFYFGHISDPDFKLRYLAPDMKRESLDQPIGSGANEKGAVFQDGGQGTQNNTLALVGNEIDIRDWNRDEIVLISLGTGNETGLRRFRSMDGIWRSGEIVDYSFFGRNQARNEAWQLQVRGAERRSQYARNFHFYRFNYEGDKALDATKQTDIEECVCRANQMIGSDHYEQLLAELVKVFQRTGRQRPPVSSGPQSKAMFQTAPTY